MKLILRLAWCQILLPLVSGPWPDDPSACSAVPWIRSDLLIAGHESNGAM
jgi:hypothetical protein